MFKFFSGRAIKARVHCACFSSNGGNKELVVKQCSLLLAQTSNVCSIVSSEHYQTIQSKYFNASIGGHVRHILNHFESLVAGSGDSIQYDIRQRGSPIEVDKVKAMELSNSLRKHIENMNSDLLTKDISVTFVANGTGESYQLNSNTSRELSFVSHHATHHLFIVRLMMNELNYAIGGDLGVAPSTLFDIAQKSRLI